MKIANVKGIVTRLMLTGLAAGAFIAASSAIAQAQQFAVGVQFGHPAYVVDHRVDRDDYRYAYRQREEFREREAREQFARRQAYLQHEQWEHQQWERDHHFDRPYDYR